MGNKAGGELGVAGGATSGASSTLPGAPDAPPTLLANVSLSSASIAAGVGANVAFAGAPATKSSLPATSILSNTSHASQLAASGALQAGSLSASATAVKSVSTASPPSAASSSTAPTSAIPVTGATASTTSATTTPASLASSPPPPSALSPFHAVHHYASGDAPQGSTFSNDRLFGFENLGNTCYCNSVLQALYACSPFRLHMLLYYETNKKRRNETDSLIMAVATLFYRVASNKKRAGTLSPSVIVKKSKRLNTMFDGPQHQDAQEFLMFLLNNISDTLKEERAQNIATMSSSSSSSSSFMGVPKSASTTASSPSPPLSSSTVKKDTNTNTNPSKVAPSSNSSSTTSSTHTASGKSINGSAAKVASTTSKSPPPPSSSPSSSSTPAAAPSPATVAGASGRTKPAPSSTAAQATAAPPPTIIESIFEGVLTNITECMRCHHVTQREEKFLDLSVPLTDNTSLTHCLDTLSNVEMLQGNDKYFCENCASRQEAYKSMRLKVVNDVVVLHLKRFKYVEQVHAFQKLRYRIPFPLELRFTNCVDNSDVPDRTYHLIAIVVHIGIGTRSGHYVALTKNHQGVWHVYNDEDVTPLPDGDLRSAFGSLHADRNQEGYLLFYSASPLV